MAFKGACLCDDFRRAIKMDSANPSITDIVSLHRECIVQCPVTQGTPVWKGSCWWHQNFAFIWSPARPHFSNVSTKSCCNFVSSHWPLPFCYLKVEQFPFLAVARLRKLLLPGGLLSSVHVCCRACGSPHVHMKWRLYSLLPLCPRCLSLVPRWCNRTRSVQWQFLVIFVREHLEGNSCSFSLYSLPPFFC